MNAEALIQELERAVTEVLAYFSGPGRTSSAKVDQWQARDVLQHFLYFHDATAWGIQSAALGGPLWPVPGDAVGPRHVRRRGCVGGPSPTVLAAPQRSASMSEHVEVAGLRIRYERSGTGPALLLLHGAFGSSAEWDQATPSLAEQFTVRMTAT